jgi:cell division protein FtsQ
MSSASIALPRLRGRSVRVLRRRFIVVAILTAILAGIYVFWFRDSSLVAVKSVHIEGTGDRPIEKRIDSALAQAGRGMTTLHVDHAALSKAVAPFPQVESVSADPKFPSSLTIKVVERRPAALIGEGSSAVAVAGDGTVLRGSPASHLHLPLLPLSAPPKGPQLGGPVLAQAEVLGAAPRPLRSEIDHSFNSQNGGVGVTLTGGVQLLFGDAANAVEKWRAAVAVLTDPNLGALDYVNLTVPDRPAVGGSSYSAPPLTGG